MAGAGGRGGAGARRRSRPAGGRGPRRPLRRRRRPAGSPAPSASSASSARPGPRDAVESKKAEATEKAEATRKADGTERTGKDRDPDSIPSSGPGTFATADGGGDRVGGSGRTLTYVVQVEDGIGIPARDVAAEVERVLANERGWTADGQVGFRRRVRLPGTAGSPRR
ncbi:DUF3152 domain-containing protein [Streptomyces sp. NPDC058534]|uniref:DUF3152 domain-containing protein n=1 Tax=Streptomyces sp. NPDC058534 TaxID=3346541 RepID=UPI00365F2270